MTMFITNSKIDSIVQDVLCKANITINPSEGLKAINIDYIVEFTYDLGIEFTNLSGRSGDAKVLAAIAPDKRTIYFNTDMDKLFKENHGLRNFSLAHELGHWVLHVDKTDHDMQDLWSSEKPFYCRSNLAQLSGDNVGMRRDGREFQADTFAAHLLMPKAMLVEYFNKIKATKKIDWPDLYKAQKELEVSISALTNRLRSLGIIYVRNGQIYENSAEYNGQTSLF